MGYDSMSECCVCQRAEFIIELPLGPFCLQCIKEIGKQYVAISQQGLLCFSQRSAYIASQLGAKSRYHQVDEWERRCEIIAICAYKRRIKPVAPDRHLAGRQTETEAFQRITQDLNRPPKKEDTDQWMKRFDRMAKQLNRRENQP